jgi:hypothetical protein
VSSGSNRLYFLTLPLVSVMRVIYTSKGMSKSLGCALYIRYALFIEKCGNINRITIMPVCLYGCGTRLLTLREERRFRVFETRVLKGPKRDKVTGEWRKLHSEELNDLSLHQLLFG